LVESQVLPKNPQVSPNKNPSFKDTHLDSGRWRSELALRAMLGDDLGDGLTGLSQKKA